MGRVRPQSAWTNSFAFGFATNEKDNTVEVSLIRTTKIEQQLIRATSHVVLLIPENQTMLYVAISEDNAIALLIVKTLE